MNIVTENKRGILAAKARVAIKPVFDLFDQDGNGFIVMEELNKAFKALDEGDDDEDRG